MMPVYCKYEVRQVTARKDGAIYKTKIIGYHWFRMGEGPECYKTFSLPGIGDDLQYCPTLETVLEARCPKGTP
jgi:hypothetical protein